MLYREYMEEMQTLRGQSLRGSGNNALLIIAALILITVTIAWITPWIQTAQGWGVVSTVDAANRTQAISALVPGQIDQWHVREGQRVARGHPIVTLVDQDPQLMARLAAERQALQSQQLAQSIAVKAAEQEFNRQQTLAEKGLASAKTRDQAQIKLQEALTKFAALEADINQANTAIARQSTQTKRAPTDGIVTRLYSGGEATAVKSGDVLAHFIPDVIDRSVVIEVNGMDAPLIQPGRKVRIQFEGWPIFQFSGWPSTAIGTFGGQVDFVEPVANARGMFNVWVSEDPTEQAWPNSSFVRLGSKARGWVLLEEVKLGYEIWRQLNNFPPKYTATTE